MKYSSFAETLYIRFEERQKHIASVGFVRLVPHLVAKLAEHGPWIEIGAGTGALAAAIASKGSRVIATDDYSWNTPAFKVGSQFKVHKIEAVRAGHLCSSVKSAGLLTAWPYMDDWAADAADKLRIGQKLAYIGEGAGGCTANYKFFNLVKLDFEEIDEIGFEQFEGLHDDCKIYQRRSINGPR